MEPKISDRLIVFENRVLEDNTGPRRKEVPGGWRAFHTE